MKSLKYFALLLLTLNITHATTYEDGSRAENWIIYDNKPAGATIKSIESVPPYKGASANDINAIELKGAGRHNAYFLGAKSGDRAWNNTEEKSIEWVMKTKEKYKIRIYVTTQKGNRCLYYSHSNRNKGIKKSRRTTYIHHGLGKISINNNWRKFSRDLEADIQEYEPDNSIIAVNGFRVNGNMLIDDIKLINAKPKMNFPEEKRFYTKDKKYFFAEQGYEAFVVETKSEKITDFRHVYSRRLNWHISKLKDIDIIQRRLPNGGRPYFHYLAISKKGKLINLDLTRTVYNDANKLQEVGDALRISDNESGYINEKLFSITYHFTLINKWYKYTYDVSNLPKVKIVSTEEVPEQPMWIPNY